MKLGKLIKEQRHKLGISQHALSCELGFKDESTISRIEQGQKKLAPKHFERVAHFMGLEAKTLEDAWCSDALETAKTKVPRKTS